MPVIEPVTRSDRCTLYNNHKRRSCFVSPLMLPVTSDEGLDTRIQWACLRSDSGRLWFMSHPHAQCNRRALSATRGSEHDKKPADARHHMRSENAPSSSSRVQGQPKRAHMVPSSCQLPKWLSDIPKKLVSGALRLRCVRAYGSRNGNSGNGNSGGSSMGWEQERGAGLGATK